MTPMEADEQKARHHLSRPHPPPALRVKAAETEKSASDLVDAAVRQSLTENAADLAVFEARAREPVLAFEDVPKGLKRRGKL